MKRFFFFLFLLLAPHESWAQRIDQLPAASIPVISDRIAAVVNDNVISTSDINQRMKLALISSGLPATPDVEQRIFPQILRNLIDEQLQLQEAKRLDISVSKEEVEGAMQRIAADNHIPGDMRDFIRERGASPEAFEAQVRASLSWNKVIQRELRPRVDVGDDEVDSVIERLRTNAGKEEFLVSEILLTVENAKDDDEVRQVAENLTQQIKNGANFGAVARQFSQSTGAASGGDIGWIQEGQLPTELNNALRGMQPGEVVGPIHSASGYHILTLREKRTIAISSTSAQEVSLDLMQAFKAYDANTRPAVLAEADQLRSTVQGCNHLASSLTGSLAGWRAQSLGSVQQSKVPGWIADNIQNVANGHGGVPMPTDKGALVVFVCDRHVPEGKADREAIANTIGAEKLELQARRLMRDLHSTAYVDLRLGDGS